MENSTGPCDPPEYMATKEKPQEWLLSALDLYSKSKGLILEICWEWESGMLGPTTFCQPHDILMEFYFKFIEVERSYLIVGSSIPWAGVLD